MAKKKSPRNGDAPSPRENPPTTPVGPLPLVKGRLQRVPYVGETWEVDFRPAMKPPDGAGADVPWLLLIGSESTNLVRACDVSSEPPTANMVWDCVAQAIQAPLAGTPARPARLLVRDDPLWHPLRDHFIEIGIEVLVSEELGLLDVVFEDMERNMLGALQLEAEATPLLDLPGMTIEKAASFFEASASFYKEKPWKRLREENAIEIACPALGGGPWYGVIMGAAGVTSGLAVYDDLRWLERVWTEQLSPVDQTEETEATALTYGPRDAMIPEDLQAMKEHGWKSGGREGYPEVYRKVRGQGIRTPTTEEIAILDASLRAVPSLVKNRKSHDDTPEEIVVASPSGPLTMMLRWVPHEGP